MAVKCETCEHLDAEIMRCRKLKLNFENGFAMRFWSGQCGKPPRTKAILFTPLRLAARIRRFWLYRFNESYVRKRIATRQGVCNNCGLCCVVWCKSYDPVTRLCRNYEKRNKRCVDFPIDETEQKLYGVYGDCSYWWET